MARDKHRRSSSLSPAPDRKEKRRRSRSRDRDRRQKERKRSRSRDRDKKRTRSRSRERKERKREKDSRGRDTHSRGDSQEEDAGGDPRVSDRWKLGGSGLSKGYFVYVHDIALHSTVKQFGGSVSGKDTTIPWHWEVATMQFWMS